MCGGKSPPPPDPFQTAQAQNSVNRDALMTAAQLNQINQVGPFGSLSYSGEIGTPGRTQTVSLSPELQTILGGQTASTNRLTELANDRLWTAPTGDFSTEGSPDVRRAGDVNFATSFNQGPAVQTSFDRGPAFQTGVQADAITKSFDPAGQVQRGVDLSGAPSLNSDFSQLSQQAQDAAYRQNQRYLDPQFQQQEDALRSRLSAQGITQGSDAYNQELENFGRQRQQAYEGARDQAIGQGFDLEAQMFGQNLAARQQGVGEQFQLGDFSNSALAQQFGMNQARAGFENQAQNQGFEQNLARTNLFNDAAAQEFARNQALAQFNNNAASQVYGQNMGAAQFGNDALARQFNAGLNLQQADQNWRDQSIQENILGRNQNINEAMAYLNGAPIAPQQPTFQPFAQSTGAQASPDMVGLAGANYNAQQQARAAMLGSIFGGIGQIGAALPWGG